MDDRRLMLKAQRNEITEYVIYRKLLEKTSNAHDRKILKRIASDELRHYNSLEKITKTKVEPSRFRIFIYMIASFFLGISFSLKFMERGEKLAQVAYRKLPHHIFRNFLLDEQRHEQELLDLLSERRLAYAGSVVLGLNDALVELTGALAGLTFALQNRKIIVVTGVVIGIAAALSMAASEYLSSREEEKKNSVKSPLKGAFYTGTAYFGTVVILVLPYLFFSNVYTAFLVLLTLAVGIIALYTLYITTVKRLSFWRRFLEMTFISLGVAVISFCIGWLLRKYVGVEV